MTRDVDSIVGELTLDEKAALLAGADMWSTVAVERLGLPSVRLTDGPNGARGASLPSSFGGEPQPSLCVPCGAALGATWDVALVERVGAVLGREARAKTCRVLLAPTVNLHRSPLGGRNFESYSEDPVLAGLLGAAFVRGVQGEGVIATVKHFAGNEGETDRFVADSVIDERTLRQVHLVPFEFAVRHGGALGVMSGYNRVNGIYCAEHPELFRILRDDWGFAGIVMTDWFAMARTEPAISCGLDLEMPGPGRAYGPSLADAVRAGRVEERLVDEAVHRLLGTLDAVGALDDEPATPRIDGRPEHRQAARQAASASITLLVNDGPLPLSVAGLRRVAVVGPMASTPAIMGGGSASLAVDHLRSPLEAIVERLGADVEVVHEAALDIGLTTPEISADLLVDRDGVPGMAIDIFPYGDFAAVPLATVSSPNGQVMWFGPPAPEVPERFSARAEAELRLGDTGRQRLSLVATGPARLLLDGEPVLSLLDPNRPAGQEFIGFAGREVTVDIDLDAGEVHRLVVEMSVDEPALVSGFKIGLRPAPPIDGIDRAVDLARHADAVIVMVGTGSEWETEMLDRTSMDLPDRQNELVTRVLDVAPDAVIVLNTGAPVTLPWLDRCKALMQIWFGGQEMADAFVDVLIGEVDPGGRLPHTMPRRVEDNPTWNNFPAELGTTLYGERTFVGHRWYESRAIPVAFAFGHGLSYTSFEIGTPSSPSTFRPGDELRIRVPVTNVGARRGSEVVQLYVAPPHSIPRRPVKELKAFAKVTLDPGETTEVELTLDERSFAHWQPHDPALDEAVDLVAQRAPWNRRPRRQASSGWVIDRGRYELHIGRSSADVAHVVPITVATDGTKGTEAPQ